MKMFVKKIHILLFLICLCNIYTVINAQDYSDDDYFYDADLTEDEVNKAKEETLKEREHLKNIQTTKPATTPAFFAKKKSKDQDINWEEYYMEKMVAQYMKKYQAEQLEKRRQKFESDLNHPLLSIITLTGFFGIGSIIGLIIVYIRGKQFRKNGGSKLDKNSLYKPVDTNENV